MRFSFVTFGCRLNRAETLRLQAELAAQGHETNCAANPDIIIVRGCSVTAKAQRDCEKAIARLRRENPSAQILLTGCLPNAQPIPTFPQGKNTQTVHTTSRAYLKVQDGCSGKCAFCIVPQFRGAPRSVPFDEVLAEAHNFIADGYREIVVTGCNLCLYRSTNKGLPELIDALAKLDCRVRLGSIEPGICNEKLAKVILTHNNVCRFIHLSLQSGSDDVLRTMRRPYTINTVANFCAKFDDSFTLGADVISGFPGENERDHQATLEFLAKHNFTNVHVFPFSERPGTAAVTMPNPVPQAERLRRAHEIEAAAKLRHTERLQSFIGKTVEVCVERTLDEGWTSEYLRCHLTDAPAQRGELVQAKVTGVKDAKLMACRCDDACQTTKMQ